MRKLWLIPIIMIAISAIGYVVCAMAGWNAHQNDMVAAGVVAVLGVAGGALLPVLLRHSTHANVAQAGLAGTAIQMMFTLGLAAIAVIIHAAVDLRAFAIWLLVYYWAQLVVLVLAIVSLVKHAKPDDKSVPAPTTPAASF